MTAYAEEAVRQALAAQVPVLTDAMILHRWDTHVGPISVGSPINDFDKIAFARAVLMECTSGHKPTPVDTSSGHSSETVRTLWDLKERYRQGLDQQHRAGEAALEACRLVVERFGPCERDYVFSKRMAIQKCRAAIAPPETRDG